MTIGALTAMSAAVFCMAFAYDFLNTRYIAAVADRHRHKAALYSVTLWAIGVSALLGVFKISTWLLIPEGLGLYVGTLYALRPVIKPGTTGK